MLIRTFNIFVSGVGILLCLFLFPAIAIIIKLTDNGPIFYTQYRVGINKRKIKYSNKKYYFNSGQLFKIYKIRTMKVFCEPCKEQWAGECDDRITKVGRFLRKLHIDELPQLWNVLRGDMSLVGPRPEQPTIAYSLSKQIENYHERLNVLPGITGLAQIENGYDRSIDSVIRKMEYDIEYISKQSLFGDIKILLTTIKKLIGGKI